jgi:acetyl esterase/lipase
VPLDAQSQALLEMFASLGLPAPETLSPPEVRAMFSAGNDERPPGPQLARVEDRTVPGPAGDIPVRIYAAATSGTLPVVVYYHGGGWVLGDLDGDDPACRSLAELTGALVVSVNYRHAPEDPFPAAVDDAYAALAWLGEHAGELGGDPSRIAVSGWSAGGNLAAVVSQLARDRNGPALRGQALVTPVTDADTSRPSYRDNGEGYLLTAPFMGWFWEHYIKDPDRRGDPLASPLRAADLSGLPPAMVVTAEYDPLRDEGEAYALAMAQAGTPVTLQREVGQIHTVWGNLGVLDRTIEVQRNVASFLRGVLA